MKFPPEVTVAAPLRMGAAVGGAPASRRSIAKSPGGSSSGSVTVSGSKRSRVSVPFT